MEAEWRRAAVYVVCRDARDRLLLTRLSMPGSPHDGNWTMPGGGMEWGESVTDTAARELAEEAGLGADFGPVLGIWSRWHSADETMSGQSGHVVGIVLRADNVRVVGDPAHEGSSTDRAEWFSPDDVRNVPHVPLVDFVLDLLS